MCLGKSKHSLKHDSRVRIPMRWTLVVSMDRKVFCRNCGQRGHWAASCPKRGKSGQGGKGQGKKGESCKSENDDGKGKGAGRKWQAPKAIDGYCNHCWKWGHVEKDCFTKSKSTGGKGKSAGSLDESEENGPENTSVGGFGLCSFRNHCDDWKWINCRKVTFTLDSGATVSAAPKSLGDDYPMQTEEPRSYKTATGSLVQDEGFRVLPIVTEEVLHRCMNFRVGPVHKALVSASKVCRKGYRIILDSDPGQSGTLHERMDRVARRKRCLRFRWLGFSGKTSETGSQVARWSIHWHQRSQ